MNIRRVRKLIELVEESGIAELEITDDGEAVRIGRHASDGAALAPAQARADARVAAAVKTSDTTEPTAPEDGMSDGYIVRSPMVGTFYRAPAPDSEPFVDVASTVGGSDTLGIIEAMKTFSEIEAKVSGRISAILVENAQPVEYNQALFVIS